MLLSFLQHCIIKGPVAVTKLFLWMTWRYPTNPYTILEPQDQEIGEFCVVQERRATGQYSTLALFMQSTIMLGRSLQLAWKNRPPSCKACLRLFSVWGCLQFLWGWNNTFSMRISFHIRHLISFQAQTEDNAIEEQNKQEYQKIE